MKETAQQWLKHSPTSCASRKSPRHTVVASRAMPVLASQTSLLPANMLLLSNPRRAIQRMAMSTTWRRPWGYQIRQTQAARRRCPSLGGNRFPICATRPTGTSRVCHPHRKSERHHAVSPRRRRGAHSRGHLAFHPLEVRLRDLQQRPPHHPISLSNISSRRQRPFPSGK